MQWANDNSSLREITQEGNPDICTPESLFTSVSIGRQGLPLSVSLAGTNPFLYFHQCLGFGSIAGHSSKKFSGWYKAGADNQRPLRHIDSASETGQPLWTGRPSGGWPSMASTPRSVKVMHVGRQNQRQQYSMGNHTLEACKKERDILISSLAANELKESKCSAGPDPQSFPLETG